MKCPNKEKAPQIKQAKRMFSKQPADFTDPFGSFVQKCFCKK